MISYMVVVDVAFAPKALRELGECSVELQLEDAAPRHGRQSAERKLLSVLG